MGISLVIIFGVFAFWFIREWLFDYSYYYDYEGKKELKVWVSKPVYNGIVAFFYLLFSISICTVIHFLGEEKWLEALASFIVFCIPVGVNQFVVKKYQIKKSWSIETIENITDTGFQIHVIQNGKLKSIQTILWRNIKKIKLKWNIRLITKYGKRIVISSSTEHYHKLLLQLPKYCKNINRGQVNSKFQDLKPCLVCGAIAANNVHCEACGSYVWKNKFGKNYKNRREYVKAKQLDLFASLHKKGLQSVTFSRDDTFKLHKEWKLLVREEEILKYSKKKFWVL